MSAFSDFIRLATSEQKAAVYAEVLRKSTERQILVIEKQVSNKYEAVKTYNPISASP